VLLLGGDCLPTLGRALVSERPSPSPRFLPETRAHAERMLVAGDGRVTRASTLATHLADAEGGEAACGLPEVSQVFIGAADHHGIYDEPTFQSVLLRTLLTPSRPAATSAAPLRDIGQPKDLLPRAVLS
jgi:hypothetical protein